MAPSKSDDFDGYRKWLGIANKNRLPTHYEVLAISLDEDDSEVIRAASEQRRHYVESKRGEGHDAIVTEIVYRINEAETTLLNDEMRRDYDRQQDLFEKRRKNRQVDPYAARSRIKSRPGKTVGEDGGIVKTFAGIMAVVVIGFGGMAWFSFGLPWSKKPAQQPEAVPVVQQPVVPQPLPQPVQPPVQAPPAVAQVEPEPVKIVEPEKPRDANAEAKKAIQGEWGCVANEQGGNSLSEDAVKKEDRRVTVKSSNFTMLRTRGTRGGYEGKFEIDAATRHFEFTGTQVGGGKFIYWFGVYELDGDTLKLSYRQKNNEQAIRPTEFKTTGEDQANPWVSGTYHRVTSVEPEKPKDAQAEAMKAMQGEWKCVLLQQNGGNGLSDKDEKLKSQDRRITIKENSFSLMRGRDGNRNGHTGKFMINAQNGHFDFIGKGPVGALNEWIGIYSVEGDTLKLCYRVKNNDKATRPTEFKTDNSDEANTMLFEKYERVK